MLISYARTTDAQWRLFHWNPELLGLARQFRQINSLEFGVFWAKLSAPIFRCPFWSSESFSMFSIIQSLFLQTIKPLYPTPKCLFGSGIWIWPKKNLRFSLCVSIVREYDNAAFGDEKWIHTFPFCLSS